MSKKKSGGKRGRKPGAVVVSKGEISHAGIVVKEWQRTPVSLLQQLMQRQKRPKPIYHKARSDGGGNRCRVILRDPKESSKDINIVTEQSFPSPEDAKHSVALLALHKMDGPRQHEMKLPEPYRTRWLRLCGREDTRAAAAAPAQAAHTCEKCGKGFSKPHALAHHMKSEHPKPKRKHGQPADDEDDSSSVATGAGGDGSGAGGATPRSDTGSAASVTSKDRSGKKVAAAVASAAAAAAASVTKAAAAKAAPKPQKRQPKMADADILLSSKGKYLSNHDRSTAQRDRDVSRAQRKNRRDARERANPDCPVLMGESNRRFVESALEQSGYGLDWTLEQLTDARNVEGGSAKQIAQVEQQLKKLGFPAKASREGATKTHGDLTAAVEWLVLTLPESALPAGFDPRGKQYEVVVEKTEDTAAIKADPAGNHLLTVGFKGREVLGALAEANGDGRRAECILHHHLCKSALGTFLTAEPDTIVPDGDIAEEIQDEVMALKSIFIEESECHIDDDGLGAASKSDGYITVRLSIGKVDGVRGTSTLEVAIDTMGNVMGQSGKYPNAIPVIWLKNTDITPAARLAATTALIHKAHELRGSPMLHELLMAAQSDLHAMISGRAPPQYRVGAAAAAAVDDDGAAGAGGDGTSASSRGSAGRGGGRRRMPRTMSADQRRRLGAELLAAEKRKDSNSKFPKMQRQRAQLPVSRYKEEILDAIERFQVVLLEGETGCGKTTQLPQFVLEDAIAKGKGGDVNIVCTQPRRIAAVGVASRVADERCERVGESVGYAIRGENKTSRNTRLLFATTGIMLRRLQAGISETFESLADLTHIIVDEVHERSVDTDFLLAILKRVIDVRPKLKIILMSATMDTSVFTRYFEKIGTTVSSRDSRPRTRRCPVIKVPGRTFPVQDVFMEDVISKIGYTPPWMLQLQRARDEHAATRTAESQAALERAEKRAKVGDSRIDYVLAAEVVRHAVRKTSSDDGGGAVLVFLPGVGEIRKLERELTSRRRSRPPARGGDSADYDWMELEDYLDEMSGSENSMHVLQLHGSLSPSDQRRVFERAPRGKTKVVLATNIAETSITIDDITTVIETGRVKETQFDAFNNMSMLVETWVSKASGMQRRGRAGRVREGTCYRLYSRDRLAAMDDFTAPEIHRVPLEQLVLQVKLLDLDDPRRFLANTITPPPDDSVMTAINQLTAIGAISTAGHLTPLGRHVAQLPLDAKLAKLLIFGCILRCIDPVLTIAATMSGRSPLMSPPDKREEARAAQAEFRVPGSDHLTLCNAFNAWEEQGSFGARRKFAIAHFLGFETMREIHDLRREFASTLVDLGFLPRRGAERSSELNECSNVPAVVQAALCAGMYPHIVNIQWPMRRYVESTGGAIPAKYKPEQLKYFVYQDGATADRNVREGRVFMHPSSVCFSQAEYPTPFLVYTEKVQTSKVFCRGVSALPTYALLLFGGDVQVQHAASTLTVGGGWIRFHASGIKIGILVRRLRLALGALLEAKFEEPGTDVSGSKVIDGILRLLRSSGSG